MSTTSLIDARRMTLAGVARIAVGLIWLAGAAFNALWTMRHLNLYQGFADDSPLAVYRWLFGDVVGAHPAVWTVLLVIGEAILGLLTLGKGRWAKLGLAGGAIWSALLFPLLWPYTLMMGPYALLLAWLARKDYAASPFDRLRLGFGHQRTATV